MSRIGIIDIGSNTFNLLVSCTKKQEKIYYKEKHVGIRKGTEKNVIQKHTISKSIFVIKKFKKICDDLNCEDDELLDRINDLQSELYDITESEHKKCRIIRKHLKNNICRESKLEV